MKELQYATLLAVLSGICVIACSIMVTILIVNGYPWFLILPVFIGIVIAIGIMVAKAMIKLTIRFSREEDSR